MKRVKSTPDILRWLADNEGRYAASQHAFRTKTGERWTLETDRRHTWYFLDDWLEEVPGYLAGADVLAWSPHFERAVHAIYVRYDNSDPYPHVVTSTMADMHAAYCIPYDDKLFRMDIDKWPAEKRKAGGMI